ncbi:MAG: NAD(P)-dependent oxidoreductase [Clostridiales bacterium]|nr:NAD(P)-dependent oxidoreductase [Clostridiales bacterium]
MEPYRILVTGSTGMIGSKVVLHLLSCGYEVVGIDIAENSMLNPKYTYINVDLADTDAVFRSLKGQRLSHIIHLAALAHTSGESDLSWERYFLINVTCAENIFTIAKERKIPIFFSSTADVYGIANSIMNVYSERNPIGNYAKSKCLAEDSLMHICKDSFYTIMRFAPVYTPEVKRDIQKRYYLKYPNLAYKVGNGIEYEVLSIDNVIKAISAWVEDANHQQILNIKDDQYLDTVIVLQEERQEGRAKRIIWIPKWTVNFAFRIMKLFVPNGWNTYMLNKVVNPIRTE